MVFVAVRDDDRCAPLLPGCLLVAAAAAAIWPFLQQCGGHGRAAAQHVWPPSKRNQVSLVLCRDTMAQPQTASAAQRDNGHRLPAVRAAVSHTRRLVAGTLHNCSPQASCATDGRHEPIRQSASMLTPHAAACERFLPSVACSPCDTKPCNRNRWLCVTAFRCFTVPEASPGEHPGSRKRTCTAAQAPAPSCRPARNRRGAHADTATCSRCRTGVQSSARPSMLSPMLPLSKQESRDAENRGNVHATLVRRLAVQQHVFDRRQVSCCSLGVRSVLRGATRPSHIQLCVSSAAMGAESRDGRTAANSGHPLISKPPHIPVRH